MMFTKTGITDGFEHYYGDINHSELGSFKWVFIPNRSIGVYTIRNGSNEVLKRIIAKNYDVFKCKAEYFLTTELTFNH